MILQIILETQCLKCGDLSIFATTGNAGQMPAATIVAAGELRGYQQQHHKPTSLLFVKIPPPLKLNSLLELLVRV